MFSLFYKYYSFRNKPTYHFFLNEALFVYIFLHLASFIFIFENSGFIASFFLKIVTVTNVIFFFFFLHNRTKELVQVCYLKRFFDYNFTISLSLCIFSSDCSRN